jgi:general secretion pathway protein I
VSGRRGFTLLEMVVATTILAIAVVGLLAGIAGAERNAARLREYDRAVALARLRMNELLLDRKAPRDIAMDGRFEPALTGGMEAGWRARVTTFERPPAQQPGQFVLDRVEVEVWWKPGGETRTFTLDGYRRRTLTPADIMQGVPQ